MRKCGFTLIELLTVIAIIGVLVALLLPALQWSRESARRTQCRNNLKQWGLSFQTYENGRGYFPAGFRRPSPAGTFVAPLLAFMEQAVLGYDLERDWNDPANAAPVGRIIPALMCPSSPSGSRFDTTDSGLTLASGDYVSTHGVNHGFCDLLGWPYFTPPDDNGILTGEPCPLATITDGLSQTFLLQEDAGRPQLWRMGRKIAGTSQNPGWADPDYELALDGSDRLSTGSGHKLGTCVINCTNDNEAYSFHSGGAFMLLADGSVHFVTDLIDVQAFAALTTKDAGDTFPGF